MAPIQVPDSVLVTGASGFLGTHFVAALTKAGFAVRGAVRQEEQGLYLKQRWGADYIVVPDMTCPNAYANAVVGVRGIVHASSEPDISNPGDAELVIGPALAGLQNLLTAISRDGSTVRRVVLISSSAAVSIDTSSTHTESEWNDDVVHQARAANADPPLKYHASKVVTERAFWKYFDTPRQCDGIALLPGYVFGEPTEFSASKGEVTGSPAVLIPWLTSKRPDQELEVPFYPGVDAGDVSEAAVRALTRNVAGRFLLCATPLFGNDFAIAAGKLHIPKLLEGNSDQEYRSKLEKSVAKVESARAKAELGIRFRDKDDMLEEAARGVWGVLQGDAVKP